MVVTSRPRITSAAAMISIPWQIDATGFSSRKKCCVIRSRSSSYGSARSLSAKGQRFHLRYGVCIHDGTPTTGYDPAQAYAAYLKTTQP
jgi:hypothetical protein